MTDAIKKLQDIILSFRNTTTSNISTTGSPRELRIEKSFWKEILSNLMEHPREYDWCGAPYIKEDCFYFEGVLVYPIMEETLEVLDKSKAYRKLSRKIAIVIIDQMAKSDIQIYEIANRINGNIEIIERDLLSLISGVSFENSLDFISDVLLAMDCEMDWSIIKPVPIPSNKPEEDLVQLMAKSYVNGVQAALSALDTLTAVTPEQQKQNYALGIMTAREKVLELLKEIS